MADRREIKPVDRSKMSWLPETQVCDDCRNRKPGSDFDLAHKNQYNRDLPHQLQKTCKKCTVTRQEAKKNLQSRAMKIGERPFADLLLKELQERDNAEMKVVMKSLLSLLDSKHEELKLQAIRLIIDQIQTKLPVIHVPTSVAERVMGIEEEAEQLPSTQQPEVTDLLGLLKKDGAN